MIEDSQIRNMFLTLPKVQTMRTLAKAAVLAKSTLTEGEAFFKDLCGRVRTESFKGRHMCQVILGPNQEDYLYTTRKLLKAANYMTMTEKLEGGSRLTIYW